MCDFSEYRGSSDEWLAIEPTLPKNATPSSVDEIVSLRNAVNRGREEEAAKVMGSLGDSIVTDDFSIPTQDGQQIRARTYKARHVSEALPVYVHLHGGGFLFGSLSSEDATCARIALDAQVLVLNVCYRHTPEHTYPTAWNDVEDAFKWLEDNVSAIGGDPHQVVLGGISAGAWLTASHLLNTTQPITLNIRGQVLMIPSLVYYECYAPQKAQLLSPEVSSYVQNKDAPILPADRMILFSDLLKVANPKEDDLRLNPGNASSSQVQHLPPTVFGVAGMDMLRDEALLYAKLLHEAGYV
ncbi:hypothetical protein KVR01_007195 [Diaporthe batatas]|uniref:uncharacterized protein n=1 Tax=Diaporthe batatas TaxID=748121 RepID=UPI001D04649D|nr:uncharacterized protein KVR01_007195 [Diaporthe batatas]KAG8162717.1 hypothetical protein KVR01_007195 [Diaporthe batatas]